MGLGSRLISVMRGIGGISDILLVDYSMLHIFIGREGVGILHTGMYCKVHRTIHNFGQSACLRARSRCPQNETKDRSRHTQALAMMMAARQILLIASIAIGYTALGAQVNGGGRCERLQLKAPLVYTQDKAPRDLSGVVSSSSRLSSMKL
jgi:hypothetical protein